MFILMVRLRALSCTNKGNSQIANVDVKSNSFINKKKGKMLANGNKFSIKVFCKFNSKQVEYVDGVPNLNQHMIMTVDRSHHEQ